MLSFQLMFLRKSARSAESLSDVCPAVQEPPKAFVMKEGSSLVASSVDTKEGKRNKDGLLVFEGHPEFKPNLTPKYGP